MRSTVIWSFLSVVALSVGGLISGCDSDATIAKSGLGESCDSSADCNDDLKCLQGACYKAPPVEGGAGEGKGTGGTTSGPPEPVLGDEGESCTKRADCKENLGCFNQRCIAAPTGEGGEGNIPGGPVLGKNGETCQTSADCETGLGCVPGGYGQQGPIGFIGVCTPTPSKLVPSGKSCGAECVKDADCCELPVALHIAWSAVSVPGTSEPYGTGANSCAELAELIGASKCTAAATGALAARCFAQAAYCECDATWTCDAGKCSYTGACTKDGPVVGGCPNFTRSGAATYPACDVDTELCAPAAGDPLCAKDTDCETLAMADTGEICAADECVCYEKTGCYRACNGPLDCKPGFTCDTADSVCKPSPACTTTAECKAMVGFGARYSCVEETCQITCSTDFDCNAGSFAAGVNTLICNPEGICEALGCSSDDQCTNGALANPVKMFCTDNVPAVTGGVSSAITD
jgi:hypothetical protein